MSRIYFHSRQRTAELLGSERHWLGHLVSAQALAAWDLDTTEPLRRAKQIIDMIPKRKEVPGYGVHDEYLHTMLQAAVEQDARNRRFYEEKENYSLPKPDYEPIRRLIDALRTRLNGIMDTVFVVNGVRLENFDIALNTAIAAGGTALQLAAKIHGRCEIHCFVDGGDRAWFAEVIQKGLDYGLFRQKWKYPGNAPDGEGTWYDQGWESVQELLRETDDGPVVLSYSVCDSFPNAEAANWTPPLGQIPDGYTIDEWDDLDEDERKDLSRDLWYELPSDEQWDLAIEGLRTRRPWLQISPDTLDEGVMYGISVYDLLAPNRDERVAEAVARNGG